jgi:hypothetical protein
MVLSTTIDLHLQLDIWSRGGGAPEAEAELHGDVEA